MIDEFILEQAALNRLEMRRLTNKIFNDPTAKEHITNDELEREFTQGKHKAYIEILTEFLGEDNSLLARRLIQDKVRELSK